MINRAQGLKPGCRAFTLLTGLVFALFGRLVTLNDRQRWPNMPVVEEIEGVRIVRAS